MPDAEHRDLNGVSLDIVRIGVGRMKRVIYHPGFQWSTHLKSTIGTELCMHTHAGFLARGSIGVRYADGCVEAFTAPKIVTISPGHDGWVIGDEAAVLIEFDFEGETESRLGLPAHHRH
jgi:hypothetical protein